MPQYYQPVAAVVRHESEGAKMSLPRHWGLFWQGCGPTAICGRRALPAHAHSATSLIRT